MSGSFVTKRDGIWHYVRRVPGSVAALDRRGIVKQSTKIRVVDDPRGTRAEKVASRINAELEAFWQGLGAGEMAEAKQRYEGARRRARAFGFDYLQPAEGAQRPLRELLERFEVRRAHETAADTAALLGGVAPPQILLSALFTEYEALTVASRKDMSPDQVRKWRNPRLRAAANLAAVLGDKPTATLTRDDAVTFQDWWRARLLAEDLDIGSANRDIGAINRMLSTLDRRHRLGLGKVFGELRIEGEKIRSRTPYPVAFVQGELLRDGALDALNAEARRAVFLMIETGLRPSEAVKLTRDTIVLDAGVPHVRVRPDGRRMKTDQSERDIPLVGVSLMGARAQPDGFPRYRDKPSSLSAIANKVMLGQKLRPPEGQTIYSLRHTFEDRLGDVEALEKMIAALMGHKHSRPKYGAGASLEQKQRWLQLIALTPPSSV